MQRGFALSHLIWQALRQIDCRLSVWMVQHCHSGMMRQHLGEMDNPSIAELCLVHSKVLYPLARSREQR